MIDPYNITYRQFETVEFDAFNLNTRSSSNGFDYIEAKALNGNWYTLNYQEFNSLREYSYRYKNDRNEIGRPTRLSIHVVKKTKYPNGENLLPIPPYQFIEKTKQINKTLLLL